MSSACITVVVGAPEHGIAYMAILTLRSKIAATSAAKEQN